MKKKITISLAMSTLFIFSACGNDSSSSSPSVSDLKAKDTLIIVQNSTKADCTHSAVKEETHGSTLGAIELPFLINRDSLLVQFEDGLVSCSKYNRSNDYSQCSEFESGDGTGKTCVVGLNYERQ